MKTPMDILNETLVTKDTILCIVDNEASQLNYPERDNPAQQKLLAERKMKIALWKCLELATAIAQGTGRSDPSKADLEAAKAFYCGHIHTVGIWNVITAVENIADTGAIYSLERHHQTTYYDLPLHTTSWLYHAPGNILSGNRSIRIMVRLASLIQQAAYQRGLIPIPNGAVTNRAFSAAGKWFNAVCRPLLQQNEINHRIAIPIHDPNAVCARIRMQMEL